MTYTKKSEKRPEWGGWWGGHGGWWGGGWWGHKGW